MPLTTVIGPGAEPAPAAVLISRTRLTALLGTSRGSSSHDPISHRSCCRFQRNRFRPMIAFLSSAQPNPSCNCNDPEAKNADMLDAVGLDRSPAAGTSSGRARLGPRSPKKMESTAVGTVFAALAGLDNLQHAPSELQHPQR